MFLETQVGFPLKEIMFFNIIWLFNCLIIFYMQLHWFQSTFNKTCSCFLPLVVWWVRGGVGWIQCRIGKNCMKTAAWDHISFPILWAMKSIGFSNNSWNNPLICSRKHQLQGRTCRTQMQVGFLGDFLYNKLTCSCSISLWNHILLIRSTSPFQSTRNVYIPKPKHPVAQWIGDRYYPVLQPIALLLLGGSSQDW